METEFKKASEISVNVRPMMSEIFVQGWYKDLQMFSKDKRKLQRTFEHLFNLDDFYVAWGDEKMLGFVAVNDRKNQRRVQTFDRREFRKHLGFFKGSFACWAMKREMNKEYPFEIPNGTGVVEFVATAESARGQGIAKKLIAHAMERESYDRYILEVVDGNIGAIKLYERLGFSEFTRAKSPYPPKHTGFEYMIYMER